MHLILTGAMLGAIGAMTAGSDEPRRAPVYLETEVIGDDVSVRVIGHADAAIEASYRLAVSSGSSGGNRSVQSGRARLEPNRQVTLIHLRLGHASTSDWSAKLEVTPTSAASYTEEKGPQG